MRRKAFRGLYNVGDDTECVALACLHTVIASFARNDELVARAARIRFIFHKHEGHIATLATRHTSAFPRRISPGVCFRLAPPST
jgi:hypothetical protein